jgi:hypothetical protein
MAEHTSANILTHTYDVDEGMQNMNLRTLCGRIFINCPSYGLVRISDVTAAMLTESRNGLVLIPFLASAGVRDIHETFRFTSVS